MSAAAMLREAERLLGEAGTLVQAVGAELGNPYLQPMAMTLAEIEHARRSCANTAKVVAATKGGAGG